jgi:hypothetical protein
MEDKVKVIGLAALILKGGRYKLKPTFLLP